MRPRTPHGKRITEALKEHGPRNGEELFEILYPGLNGPRSERGGAVNAMVKGLRVLRRDGWIVLTPEGRWDNSLAAKERV